VPLTQGSSLISSDFPNIIENPQRRLLKAYL
jgi:hypothetical protein